MLYKDLVVWQKAHALAIKTIKAVNSMPSSRATNVVSGQLISAVTSVGANIAEGYGRGGPREYARFLQIAFGSGNEVDNWLTLARDAEILPAALAAELLSDNQEILRMLWTLLRRLKAEPSIRKSVVQDESAAYLYEVDNEYR